MFRALSTAGAIESGSRQAAEGEHVAEVKVRKKDLQAARRPDAVLKGATSTFDWLWERRNPIFIAMGTLVGVTGVWTLIQNTQASGRNTIGEQLSEAADISLRPVVEKPPPDDEKDLGEKPETFASNADKAKALNDALSKLVEQHGDTPAGISAALDLAQVRLGEGKYDEAVALAQKYIDHSDGTGLSIFAYETLGDAKAAKKDYAGADEAFKKIDGSGAPSLALYDQARLLELQGKKDEARKAYGKVISDYEKDSVATQAHARLDLMDLPAPGVGELAPPAEPAGSDDTTEETPGKTTTTSKVTLGPAPKTPLKPGAMKPGAVKPGAVKPGAVKPPAKPGVAKPNAKPAPK